MNETKMYPLSVTKYASHGVEIYSMGNIVTILYYLCMVTDGS